MLKQFMEKDMAKLFVINLATTGTLCVAVFSVLIILGAFPWAMPKDIDHLEKKHEENNLQLEKKYDQMIILKNQDNKWYRELEIKVATMSTDIGYIKDDIKEIKRAVVRGH